MFVNAMIRLNTNQVEQFLNNWRFDEDTGARLANDFAPYQTRPFVDINDRGTPAIDVYNPDHCMPDFGSVNKWKVKDSGPVNVQGTLITISCREFLEPDWTDPQDPEPKIILTVLHYLRETFAGQFQILDVFKPDGIRHGQTYVAPQFDLDGNPTTPEQILGLPTYPSTTKADMVGHMPDDVVYDDDGNEISRTPANDYKEVHTFAGYRSRRYE